MGVLSSKMAVKSWMTMSMQGDHVYQWLITILPAWVKTDRWVRIKDIAQELDISFGSAFNIIHECLGYRKVSCWWVPKQLDDVMKGKQMIASLNHLQRYAEEGDNFLDCNVTGDETWVLHYMPESKQQSMVWKHLQSPVRKNSVLCHLFTKWC